MCTSQHKMAKDPLKYCSVLSQSEHNSLDNNSTNYTVQTCTNLCLSLSHIGVSSEKTTLFWVSFKSSHISVCWPVLYALRPRLYLHEKYIITRFILLRGYYEITIRLTIFWVGYHCSLFLFLLFADLLFLSLYASLSACFFVFFLLWSPKRARLHVPV